MTFATNFIVMSLQGLKIQNQCNPIYMQFYAAPLSPGSSRLPWRDMTGEGQSLPLGYLFFTPPAPTPTYSSLLLPSVDSGKGWDWWKAHMYPVTLVLYSSSNQGRHRGAISILCVENVSFSCEALVWVSLRGGGRGRLDKVSLLSSSWAEDVFWEDLCPLIPLPY